MKKILVTGCYGFIGFSLIVKISKIKNYQIFGIDNINDYYDVKLKKNRAKILKKFKNFSFSKLEINNKRLLNKNFKKNKYDIVINLAAQAGVRYSLLHPSAYFESNIKGFFNILELSRIYKIKHLIFASSSSVYGDKNRFPLKEIDSTDNPVSFYAASKKTNEIMSYAYAYSYKIPVTGLRLFTVYGPYGRPDMALEKFTNKIVRNQKIDIYNFGNNFRDFTFIDDVTESIKRLINNPSKSHIPYQIFNIGNGKSINIMTYVNAISSILRKKVKYKLLKQQKSDVVKTHSSIIKLKNKIKFVPKTNLKDGITKYIKWYKDYYLNGKK